MTRNIKMTEAVNRKNGKRILFVAVALFLLIGGARYVFRQSADDFREIAAVNIERLHTEIRAERYREIFLSNDRRLIVN